jgi:general stress protein 26
MTVVEPGVTDVEQDIVDLLRETEMGALATITPTGEPAATYMHFASDGLAVYLHTFTDTRTCAAIRRGTPVSYVLANEPPPGLDGHRLLRAVQVDGTATVVTDEDEIDTAIRVSREQFAWLKDSRMYDNTRRPSWIQRQMFFRIDPVSALWTDNRVRMLWRKLVTFTPDGKHVAELEPYQPVAA